MLCGDVWNPISINQTSVFTLYIVREALSFVIALNHETNMFLDFDVLLTVHLSIILVIDQLNAQILVL